LQKHNIPVEEGLIRHSTLSEDDVVGHTNALLDLPQPPDALFAINDPAAIQAMLLMKKRGIRIPEEVAVVGFNNSPESNIIEPGLTTVEQPSYKIGQIAAKHILEQINQPEDFSPQMITLKTELVIRNSSRKSQLK
jgi:DNA-binding LacI/PurR family transcriptional regulator